MKQNLLKAICIAWLFMFFCTTIVAQSDTLYVNELGAQVAKQDANYYRIILHEDSLYAIFDYDFSHQLRKKVHYTSSNAVIMEGEANYFDKKGKPIAMGKHHNGFPIGEWDYYYQGGKHLKNKNIYQADRSYYTIQYDSISGKKETEGNMTKDEIKIGQWKKYYFRSDSLEWTLNYEAGKKEGEQVQYYPSGKIKRKEYFHNNKMGKAALYNEEGKQINYFPSFVYPESPVKLRKYLYASVPCFNPILAHKSITLHCKVHQDGHISNIQFENVENDECQEQLIAAMQKLKKWKPAMVEKEKVDCPFTYTFKYYGKSD
jgi:hypothetical protein